MNTQLLVKESAEQALKALEDGILHHRNYGTIRKMVYHMHEPLLQSVGYWGFLWDFIPLELRSDDPTEYSPAEIAIVRACQLYAFHQSSYPQKKVLTDDDISYPARLKSVNYRIRRTNVTLKFNTALTTKNLDIVFDAVVYLIKLSKGDFRANYSSLAVDFYNMDANVILLNECMHEEDAFERWFFAFN